MKWKLYWVRKVIRPKRANWPGVLKMTPSFILKGLSLPRSLKSGSDYAILEY